MRVMTTIQHEGDELYSMRVMTTIQHEGDDLYSMRVMTTYSMRVMNYTA